MHHSQGYKSLKTERQQRNKTLVLHHGVLEKLKEIFVTLGKQTTFSDLQHPAQLRGFRDA